ncbi:BTB/POZ domain-containing protein 9 isoform X2 [Daktulosphaira vitifoliae]|uniref:BTB/POZ domain-containing protein 9 isoform X2 n=1 Tax=Daktulosphaira vitifoliae TaxID=58002 RepID=UPI0021AAAD0A|nr:BTB/POZ domain-containing protein 9 isoform X2 [Daktulosphaira vitifoliae]
MQLTRLYGHIVHLWFALHSSSIQSICNKSYGHLFYTHRSNRAMSGQQVADGGGGAGSTSSSSASGDHSPAECKSPLSIAKQHSYEQIDHAHFLASDIGTLYLNDRFSDVVLLVNGERFHAHRVVLASRSDYFRALLYGGLKESHQSEVEISEASVNSFKKLLEYIYSGRMNLSILKDEVILEIFSLSNLFGFTNLELSLSKYLRSNINVHNVCSMFAAARLYQHKELVLESLIFIDNHAHDVLQSEAFLSLSPEALQEILNRDSLYAYELDIFRAVCRWIKANQDDEYPEAKIKVLSAVRYPLMSLDELLSVVRESQLVSSDNILDAIQLRNTLPSHKLKFRGQLKPNLNIAHPSQGTQVMQGEMRSALLESDTNVHDHERGCTRHLINETDSGIMIKLGHPSIINYIKMQLWDKDLRSYSYYIEVSMDQHDWVRVIDYSNYYCRSTQRLWIQPRVVRYIRIVGTNNTVNKTFHVVSMEVMYNTEEMQLVEIEKGLVAPKYNVATMSMNAIVIDGVSRSRNSLLDGNYKDYDWDCGYTCHQLGSGCILVQLGQPYMLNSIRMLLWDCDDRYYSYYIEVSVNMWDWELIVDKSKELVRSWQVLQFKPRPIVFIRITGVYNSANEVFHCVHLEAPAQVPLELDVLEVEKAVENLQITKKLENNDSEDPVLETSADAPVI